MSTINYRETYEIVTPESAEDGDAAERGFIDENASDGFRGIVDTLRGTEPSCWPMPTDGGRVWYTCSGYDHDYRTGGEESRSYHPVTERDGRYMRKAWLTGNKRR